jgi:bacterioferritin (cytochrome b1)
VTGSSRRCFPRWLSWTKKESSVVYLLNRILEAELAGVVRYTHYSFFVFGHNRAPIVSWMREQAAESLTHAQQAGEMITLLGEDPSLAIGPPSTAISTTLTQSCGSRWTPSAQSP